ncbi:MAG: isochorismate synthase [Nitriliruptorales bacterium]|nr:isochorismate synthase [Nitriliruptorales bacterium]
MSTGTRLGRRGVATRTEEVEDPRDLLAYLPERDGSAWVRRGEGLLGRGVAARIEVGAGEDRFARAAARLAEYFAALTVEDPFQEPGSGPVAFASFTFDPSSRASSLIIPAAVLGRRAGRAWRTSLDPGPAGGEQRWSASARVRMLAPARITYAGSSIPEVRWLEAVATAAAEIREGDANGAGAPALRKVVLARDLLVSAGEPLDIRLLVSRLAERFPDCYTFCCDGMLGATPELLLRRTGRQVTSLVLAGSAPRGGTPTEDERLGAALLRSAKDAIEHRLSVESVRDGLAPLCDRLEVQAEPSLLRLDNVQHLATRVDGRLSDPLTALDVTGRLHPTAAICGTPTALARERIGALEGMDRGRYSGPVGWVDSRGDGEFGIALRCAELTERGARLFAGAGVVGGSLPEAELEETRLKLRAMRSALE